MLGLDCFVVPRAKGKPSKRSLSQTTHSAKEPQGHEVQDQGDPKTDFGTIGKMRSDCPQS